MVSASNKRPWDAKKRTLLKNIQPGDIFCFDLGSGRYGFGRIMAKIPTGHVAEIFDAVSAQPGLPDPMPSARKIPPLVIDSYGLFDKKIEGDWRVIAHTEGYMPDPGESIAFKFGVGASRKKVDLFGKTTPIDEREAQALPQLTPHGDAQVKALIGLD